MESNFSENYLKSTSEIIKKIDSSQIEKAVMKLSEVKNKSGRLFVLGLGGGAAHCIHAVSDFRKIALINALTPLENITELSAGINDNGWEDVFINYLKSNKLNSIDALMIVSVGGGDLKNNISSNLIKAIAYAKEIGSITISITGREEGYANNNCDVSILIPVNEKNYLTPQTEGLQSIILHLLVSHPLLKEVQTKWESVDE